MEKLTEGTEEFKTVKAQWMEKAQSVTIDTLADFLRELTEEYTHDYGTICHATAIAAIAGANAVNQSEQGGITGFQAGAVMWEFVRAWNYSGNKTGLRMVDYDNFLYPQYADRYQKTITPRVWQSIQTEAAAKIAEVEAQRVKYAQDLQKYEQDIAAFVLKFPDYYERREHYDPLGMGTGEQWEAEAKKKASGFEFAPQSPYPPIGRDSNVYRHWVSIVEGVVPFGYTIAED